MAQQTKLDVAPRTVVGKATRHLRKEGQIPANIYGHKEAPVAVQIDAHAFEQLRRVHGLKSVLTLQLPDAAAQTALVRHLQHDPITGHILHIDFVRVSLGERIEARIPLHFVGEAPGVKIQGGILLHLVEALQVECRAADIVEHLEVDVTPLAEIGSVLHARDVRLPAGYTLITDGEEPIVKVDQPRIQVEEGATAPETPAATETPESTGA